MTDRIRQSDLEAWVRVINRAHGFGDDTPLWTREGEHNVSTEGMYYLDYAYGGVMLARMSGHGGGIEDVFRSGHVPKRDLYNRMRAYVDGMIESNPS